MSRFPIHGGKTYSYNANNLLIEANTSGTTQLRYDAENRLHSVEKSASYTGFLYDGSDLIAEVDDNGNVLRRYVHGPAIDDPIVWYEGAGTGTKRYFHENHQGSIVGITNQSGGTYAINAYDEYGNQGPDNTGRFQYTGQLWLEEAELYYYKARFYNPGLGRFMQTDPIGYAAGLNWYAYVGNDPVNLIDPSGMNQTTREQCEATGSSQCHYQPPEREKEKRMEHVEVTGHKIAKPPCGFDCASMTGKEAQSLIRLAALKDISASNGSASKNLGYDSGGQYMMHLSSCVADNRFDLEATLGTLVGAGGGAPVPKTAQELTRGGANLNPDISKSTTRLSRAGLKARANYGRQAAGLSKGLRVSGRALNAVAIPLLVFEGFYDWGTIARCSVVSASD